MYYSRQFKLQVLENTVELQPHSRDTYGDAGSWSSAIPRAQAGSCFSLSYRSLVQQLARTEWITFTA